MGNFGPFVAADCLMIKPTGVYMRNEGASSREEMCKTFLTWLAPQQILSIDNLRFMGASSACSSCTAQIRMLQHFSFHPPGAPAASIEEDVAVFTFVLEAVAQKENPLGEGVAVVPNTSAWRAVVIHRAVGAPPTGRPPRNYEMELTPAPATRNDDATGKPTWKQYVCAGTAGEPVDP